jgi:hypothetical protein
LSDAVLALRLDGANTNGEIASHVSLPLVGTISSRPCLLGPHLKLRRQTMKAISELFDTHEEASKAVDALEDAAIAYPRGGFGHRALRSR